MGGGIKLVDLAVQTISLTREAPVNVENYYIETPEDIAERIRKVLQYVPAEKLIVVPDCGFSQTARWAARAKLHSMVAGTGIVLEERA